MQNWLLKVALNLLGLLVALWGVYRAGYHLILLLSYRALATNPLDGLLVHDVPIALIGMVACWACFRTVENLYNLARRPPR